MFLANEAQHIFYQCNYSNIWPQNSYPYQLLNISSESTVRIKNKLNCVFLNRKTVLVSIVHVIWHEWSWWPSYSKVSVLEMHSTHCCLDEGKQETVIHVLVTSRLDNNNAILAGVSDNQINRLQKLQKTAARIVLCSQKIRLHQYTWLTLLASCEGRNLLPDSSAGFQGSAWPRTYVLVLYAEALWANLQSSFPATVSAWGTQDQTGDRRWQEFFHDWTQTVECTASSC